MTAERALSPEDRERIRAEAREVLRRVMAEEPAPKKTPAQRSSRAAGAPSKRGTNLLGHPPIYSRDDIKEMYENGMPIGTIARKLGAQRSTIRRALREQGVTVVPETGGAPRKEYCGKGIHLMSEHGRELKGGGRYCAPCRAKTSADHYQRSKAGKYLEAKVESNS